MLPLILGVIYIMDAPVGITDLLGSSSPGYFSPLLLKIKHVWSREERQAYIHYPFLALALALLSSSVSGATHGLYIHYANQCCLVRGGRAGKSWASCIICLVENPDQNRSIILLKFRIFK